MSFAHIHIFFADRVTPSTVMLSAISYSTSVQTNE